MTIRSFDPFSGIEQPVDWDAVEAVELRREETAEWQAELERDRRFMEDLI